MKKSLTLNQRKALAQIGHLQHLNKLVNDPEEYVRRVAKSKLRVLKS